MGCKIIDFRENSADSSGLVFQNDKESVFLSPNLSRL